jgi:hypothetical protein
MEGSASAPSPRPRRPRARMRMPVSVTGGETVEGVAADIDIDEATLWKQTEQVQLASANERLLAEEGIIKTIVHSFIAQVVPHETLDPEHLCDQQCFYGGETHHAHAKPSWFIPIHEGFQLYGCRVHGSVHRCHLGQCYATRVDRDSHEFCLYSGHMIGGGFDATRSNFAVHAAYFSVRKPATYRNLVLEEMKKMLEHKWSREQAESAVHQKIIAQPPTAKKVRRPGRRRTRRTRVLSNTGELISTVVTRLFFAADARAGVVDRLLATARRQADDDLRAYHDSLPVQIKGVQTQMVQLCDPMRVLGILSAPFRVLDHLCPAYPWPDDPFVVVRPDVERTPEAEEEIDGVCQMVEAIWEGLQGAKCVTSSSLSLTNLTLYLVFSLGNSPGVVFEKDVLYPSTPFLRKWAPSKEWAVHAALFASEELSVSVSSISEGQRDFKNGMRALTETAPSALIDLKNNLRSLQDVCEPETA